MTHKEFLDAMYDSKAPSPTLHKEQEIEKIKDWIETSLDGDAHGPWVRAPLFQVIEDVAELMAPRIATKLNEVRTTALQEALEAVEMEADSYFQGLVVIPNPQATKESFMEKLRAKLQALQTPKD